jgi:hypothetical protein
MRPVLAVPRREIMALLFISLLLLLVPLFFIPLREPDLPEPFTWVEFSRLDAHAIHATDVVVCWQVWCFGPL